MARRAASTGLRAQAPRDASPTPPETGAEDEEVTRCICGNQEFVQTSRTRSLHAVPGLYVQCERCNVWQHGFCMGFSGEEDIPNEYYCELCEPSFHHITTKHGLARSKYAPPSTPTEPATKETTPPPPPPPEPAVNQNSIKSEPETINTHSPPTKSETISLSPNNETLPLKPEKPVREDTRKRRSRPSSDESPYLRNRKQRRSREDEILQRVLEESAREAREAESRRRSQDGAKASAEIDNESALREDSPDTNEPETADGASNMPLANSTKTRNTPNASSGRASLSSSHANDENMVESTTESGSDRTKSSDSARTVSTQRRSTSDTPTSGASKGEHENSRKTAGASVAPTSNTKNGAVLGASTSRRRQRATRSVANGASATGTASPRRNGGSRRSKMRTPSQRSTLTEMRRRVAAILDFSSRTQDELIDDQKTRIIALQPVDMSSEDGVRYEQLLRLSQTNLGYLEDLTSQLLKWEEQFGISSP